MLKKFLNLKNHHAPRGSFKHNVFTLMTGTAIGQAIPVIFTPFLTRFYSPADFGVFVLYIAFVNILSAVTCARYEQAILLPSEDKDAFNVLILSLKINLISTLLIFISILLFKNTICFWTKNNELGFWLNFLPFSILFSGSFWAFNYWMNRRKQFSFLAKRRIIQALIMVFVQFVLGLLGYKKIGLISGWICGECCVFFMVIYEINLAIKVNKYYVGLMKHRHYLHKYRNFFVYDMPATFINVVSNQLPVVLLGIFFNPIVVGHYGLTQRVLNMPVTLLSQSIADVFKQQASSDYAKYGNCYAIYVKTLKTLSMFSLIFFVVLVVWAPTLFSFLFGSEWRVAGEYARIMAIYYSLRFTAGPLNYILLVVQKQKYNLFMQLFLFLFGAYSIYLGGISNKPKLAILYFSITYAILYLGSLILSYQLSLGNKMFASKNKKTIKLV